MNLDETLKRDYEIIISLIKELDLEYDFEFMLKNFKSMFLSIELHRSRIIAVMLLDKDKTKRIQVKTINNKLENAQELVYKCSILISLYKQFNALKEVQELENGLTTLNGQLMYAGYKFIKELKSR
ncbi:MAG: hypothetical protein AB7D38_02930 [Sulfurimonas sp.]|uniref:hypothetical protein n=1 Tax=Sulfurimonas sp. TaxID=2022749 RepID=UPI003D0D16DA